MASAAGGTSHRLHPGAAIVRERSRSPTVAYLPVDGRDSGLDMTEVVNHVWPMTKTAVILTTGEAEDNGRGTAPSRP